MKKNDKKNAKSSGCQESNTVPTTTYVEVCTMRHRNLKEIYIKRLMSCSDIAAGN